MDVVVVIATNAVIDVSVGAVLYDYSVVSGVAVGVVVGVVSSGRGTYSTCGGPHQDIHSFAWVVCDAKRGSRKAERESSKYHL